MSFPGNIPQLIAYINKAALDEQIVLIHANNQSNNLEQTVAQQLKLNRPIQFIKSMYHLATSRYILVDNYYGFLAVTHFNEEAQCIQLWHANGALKRFGLEDLTNNKRSKRAIRRFQAVYDRFDSIVVSSRKMENIFRRSFGVNSDARFLRTGIPRTDFFFDPIQKQRALQQFKTDFPKANNKKVLLYAPTYREDQLSKDNITLNINFAKLSEQLQDDYILLLRLHPAISHRFSDIYSDFIINVSEYESIDTLMVGADILITDYSSIPFEFALLQKPIIFYAYDFDTYASSRGLVHDYENIVPGPIVKSTDDLIDVIKEQAYDLKQIEQFANEWNEYADGHATEKIIASLYDVTEAEKEKIREHV